MIVVAVNIIWGRRPDDPARKGFGDAFMPEAIKEEALRIGLSLGMTLIVIGRVIAGQRDRVPTWDGHHARLRGKPRPSWH